MVYNLYMKGSREIYSSHIKVFTSINFICIKKLMEKYNIWNGILFSRLTLKKHHTTSHS